MGGRPGRGQAGRRRRLAEERPHLGCPAQGNPGRAGCRPARQDCCSIAWSTSARPRPTASDGSVSDPDYADGFRAAGIDLAKLPPAEAGARIKARPHSVATALAEALDDWAAICRGRSEDAAGAAVLSGAAQIADPDPWRIDLRERPGRTRQGGPALPVASRWKRRRTTTALGPISLGLLGSGLISGR